MSGKRNVNILVVCAVAVALYSVGNGIYGLWTYQMASAWNETASHLVAGIIWPVVWLIIVALWSRHLH